MAIAPAIGAALISTAPWLLNLIFGGGDDEDEQVSQETITETTPQGFQDPLRGVLGPAIAAQLIGNWDLMKGAGMPGGKGGTGFGGDMFADIIKLLQEEWPTIIEGYGETKDERVKDCRSDCRETYKKKVASEGTDNEKAYSEYQACLKGCGEASDREGGGEDKEDKEEGGGYPGEITPDILKGV